MHITFAPRGILQIDDARIIYRNFSGAGSKFNREGDRNFSVVIEDQDIADALIKEGWNVKIKAPREEGDMPFMHLPVKIKFSDRGPSVYLKTGSAMNKLDEESIDILDNVDILGVDLDIRPYDWEVNGKEGRTAYLQSIHVIQQVDRFAERYGFDED
jgi:hypothetical protein